MKWLFLINNVQFLPEFLGRIAHYLEADGDGILLVVNSKIAEYEKIKFFPKKTKVISKVDWCASNYDSREAIPSGISWREIFPNYERFKSFRFDYKKCLQVVSHLCQLFKYIFTEERPDVVIGESPAGLFHEIAYHFCQKNNIKYLGISESRINGRVDIFDTEWTFSEYEETFNNLKKENLLSSEVKFCKEFIEKFVSHRMVASSLSWIKIKFNLVGFIKHYFQGANESNPALLRYFINRNKLKNIDYESEIVLKHRIMAPFKTVKRNIKIFLQKGFFEKNVNILEDKYFFFPLQYEPEASTLVLATYYSNQLNTVKNVAFTLPISHKLYLKEHPGSIGTRANKFYKELKKIPNVVLLSPEEPIQEIIQKSSGVITLTSTVGLEAALVGKYVYVFGNVFYNYHPMCRRLLNFDNLKEQIQKDLDNKKNVGPLEEINNLFVASYLRNNIAGDMCAASGKRDDNNYQIICQTIKRLFFRRNK